MTTPPTRRSFLLTAAALGAAVTLRPRAAAAAAAVAEQEQTPDRPADPLFKISLAQWSLHNALQKKHIDHLDFARIAKQDYGIEAVEYVNQFFKDKAKDLSYLREMKSRADDLGVFSHLIMCDGEGSLAEKDEAARRQAIENHFKWIVAAAYLGCLTIRVNAYGSGTPDEQQALAADSLHHLAEFADGYNINVIVENHGGLTSNGEWLAGVMRRADHPRVGTLPDFGNFHLDGGQDYDRYKGVGEMMPFAKAVSAKSYAFDKDGNETTIDYRRMLKIVVDAGYRGWIGIEFENDTTSEPDGITATLALLLRLRRELA